jgi:hypothetical protein
MLWRCAVAFVIALFPVLVRAAPARNGTWLLQRLAAEATQQAAHASNAADANTWRAWARVYAASENDATVQNESALALVEGAIRNNQQQVAIYTRLNDAKAVGFWRGSLAFWQQLAQQLEAGGDIAIRFPTKAMLTPIPGLAGTPWENQRRANAADCATIAEHIRNCLGRASLARHQNMMGNGSGGFTLLTIERECHQWQEMQLAYCHGR